MVANHEAIYKKLPFWKNELWIWNGYLKGVRNLQANKKFELAGNHQNKNSQNV